MLTMDDFLQGKAARLRDMREHLSDPLAPPVALSATARIAGSSGVRPISIREFTVVSDSGAALAGHDLGPSSPELLLGALASCLAHTFLIVGVAHSISYDHVAVEVTGTLDYRGMLEMDDAPVNMYDVQYRATLGSAASDEQLEAVRHDVERLCPVLQTFTRPVSVSGGWHRPDEAPPA